jgi:hypothetical protein
MEPKRYPGAAGELPRPVGARVGRFGEFDETGTGTDLTLEWDSNDPDLHARTAETSREAVPGLKATTDDSDRYRHFREAGLPDA